MEWWVTTFPIFHHPMDIGKFGTPIRSGLQKLIRGEAMKEIRVGLIGFGTVGSGVVKILQENGKLIEKRTGAKIILKRIADIDLETDRGVKLKPEILTSRAEDVIEDPEIDIVMELMGGLSLQKSLF